MFHFFSDIVKNIEVNVFFLNCLKIASLRKVNIAHPYAHVEHSENLHGACCVVKLTFSWIQFGLVCCFRDLSTDSSSLSSDDDEASTSATGVASCQPAGPAGWFPGFLVCRDQQSECTPVSPLLAVSLAQSCNSMSGTSRL